jgi:hypothetical protein
VRAFVSLDTNRVFRSYTSGGVSSVIPDDGRAWTGPSDEPSMLTFNNRLLAAIKGNMTDLIKVWDGTGSFVDLKNVYNQRVFGTGRSSAGTTRTLVLTATFKGQNGDDIIVSDASGPNASFYNGTYPVTSVTTTNITNDTITYTATGILNEAGTADAAITLDGTAPKASILREHLGRVWTDDKENKDRLHYSGSFNHTQWLGYGDSAALDVGVGDGDPEGITAIFPSFKGDLFVAKRTKLYRVRGYSPETFIVELVSSGIGCVSHNAIALIDQDDMVFVSEKGVHSIAATNNYGDFGGAYLSQDIQKTFLMDFSHSRLKYAKAAYNPELNSIAFAFTDSNVPDASQTTLNNNNSIWLYNTIIKAWYRWPDLPCQALIVANDGDKKRFYLGTDQTRIVKTELSNDYDIGYAGQEQAINFYLETGQIPLDQNLYTVKGLKRFILFYRPEGSHTLDVEVLVDNIPLSPENTLLFNETGSGTLLGVNFILGQSKLGSDAKLAAYTKTVDGYGRTVKIIMRQNSIRQRAEIQGFGIEFEVAGTSPEVALSSSGTTV